MSWQPIETAPRDGTSILVYADYKMFVARWIEQNPYCPGWWHVDDNKYDQFALCGHEPTHWMPLPEPPKYDNLADINP
jgi:hypothetical protein